MSEPGSLVRQWSDLAKSYRRLAALDAVFGSVWVVIVAFWAWMGSGAPGRPGQWIWVGLSIGVVAAGGWYGIIGALRRRRSMLAGARECEAEANLEMLRDYQWLNKNIRSAFKVVQ